MDSMKQPTATYGCCWLRFVTLWAETSPPKHAYIDPFETPSGGDRLKAHTFGEDSLSACEHVLRPSGEYLGPHGLNVLQPRLRFEGCFRTRRLRNQLDSASSGRAACSWASVYADRDVWGLTCFPMCYGQMVRLMKHVNPVLK